MDNTRRGFLKTMMAATAAAFAAAELGDPELLLWTPRAKTFIDLGANKPIIRPTDDQVARIVLDTRQMGALPPLTPIYMPDRFKFTSGNGEIMTFDSDFRPTSRNGRQLTAQQKVELAIEMTEARKSVAALKGWGGTRRV